MNTIEIKKTTDITEQEIEGVATLFKEVFSHKMTLESFKNRYLNTPTGCSVHALLKDEKGTIVGCHHLVPFYYIFDGKKQETAATA